MKKGLLVTLAVIVLLAAFVLFSYNGTIRLQEEVKKGWSNVEVNYQRRADLIPNLVETVKGYATHETELFENIAKLRSRFSEATTPAELEQADRELTTAINVAVEAYPEMKSDQLYLNLMDELAGTENRVAVSIRDYNDAATRFNRRIRSIPMVFVAGMLGFEPVDLFQARSGSDTVPAVDFSS